MTTPTIVEAMTDATAELHAAALEMRTTRDTFVNTATQVVQQTTALVATVTPLQRVWWVDPVNGNDANEGSTAALAKKTVEAVCNVAPPNTRHFLLLLGDTTMMQAASLQATMSIVGAQAAANASGYIVTRRRIDFRSEATNSPTSDGARRSGGFLMSAQLALRNIDVVLPDQPEGVLTRLFLGSNLSSVTMTDFTINGTTLGNGARVLTPSDASPMGFWFLGTLGPGVSGRIFDGVGTGADPTANRRYQTNLTSN